MIDAPQTTFRVRYSDVDRMGFLYHVNYLEYFEVARSDWIRHIWKPYKEIEDSGLALVVIEAHLNYLSPARYDELLCAQAILTDFGRSRLRFDYRIFNAEDASPRCNGSTAHCFIDRSGKPVKMPDELRELLERMRSI